MACRDPGPPLLHVAELAERLVGGRIELLRLRVGDGDAQNLVKLEGGGGHGPGPLAISVGPVLLLPAIDGGVMKFPGIDKRWNVKRIEPSPSVAAGSIASVPDTFRLYRPTVFSLPFRQVLRHAYMFPTHP